MGGDRENVASIIQAFSTSPRSQFVGESEVPWECLERFARDDELMFRKGLTMTPSVPESGWQ